MSRRRHQQSKDRNQSSGLKASVVVLALIFGFLLVSISFPRHFMTVWLGFWDLVLLAFSAVWRPWSARLFFWGFAIVGGLMIVGGVYLVLEQAYHWLAGASKQSAASEYRVK